MSIQKNCGIGRIVEKQRVFFESGKTFDLGFRKAALKRLERAISELEGEICEALAKDLGKSRTEGYMCEVGLTLGEIREQRRNLRRWSRTERTGAGLANFPAKGYIVQEPYGTVLIMSPWNYPFMLAIEPLAGAIAAGKCCVIKPFSLFACDFGGHCKADTKDLSRRICNGDRGRTEGKCRASGAEI